jgi:hypothetical protein
MCLREAERHREAFVHLLDHALVLGADLVGVGLLEDRPALQISSTSTPMMSSSIACNSARRRSGSASSNCLRAQAWGSMLGVTIAFLLVRLAGRFRG